MKKFHFKFEGRNWSAELSQLKQFIKDLSGQYHSIHIQKIRRFEWSNEHTKVIEKIGKEARCLKIMMVDLQVTSLKKIFESLPYLEIIVMDDCYTDYKGLLNCHS